MRPGCVLLLAVPAYALEDLPPVGRRDTPRASAFEQGWWKGPDIQEWDAIRESMERDGTGSACMG